MAFVTDQAKVHRVLRVPEYFANYRERGDELSSFLGASIVAKVRILSRSMLILPYLYFASAYIQ